MHPLETIAAACLAGFLVHRGEPLLAVALTALTLAAALAFRGRRRPAVLPAEPEPFVDSPPPASYSFDRRDPPPVSYSFGRRDPPPASYSFGRRDSWPPPLHCRPSDGLEWLREDRRAALAAARPCVSYPEHF